MFGARAVSTGVISLSRYTNISMGGGKVDVCTYEFRYEFGVFEKKKKKKKIAS